MERKYVIGLDYGTLSGRAIIADCKDGTVLASAVKEYDHGVMSEYLPDGTELTGTGWALQNPKNYIDVLKYIIPEAVAQSGVSSKDIIGIGLDFTSCTMLPVDENNVPLCLLVKNVSRPHAWVKLWKHHGAQKQADEINELLKKRGEIDNIQFGGKISSELLLPKILQIVEEDPELYDEAASFLEVGDWLTQILTNGRKRSGNLAGYKAMWTPETGYPSKDFLLQLSPKLENLTEDKLGDDITLAGQPVGYLTKDWAKELGLCAGIPIATAVIDSHAGMPGSGVSKSDQMMMVLGTSSVMLALSENGYSKNGVVSGIKGAILPKQYALESGLAAVGDMLGWFVDNCVSWEYKQMADQQGMDLHSWLTRKAEKLSPGGHGLLALDWWNGNKTPYVDGRLSGVLVGCTLLTKPEEIYRALIESTAFGTKKIMQLFAESGVKIHTIIASGGIAEKNSLLMQIYADVLNCEIHISGTEQTAALGAAIYASVAAGKDLGGYETIQEAVANMSHLKDIVYKPNPPMVEKYVELYQMYCNLVEMFNPQKNTTMITLSQLH